MSVNVTVRAGNRTASSCEPGHVAVCSRSSRTPIPLLGTATQSATHLSHYVHHQTRDRFDVLRSKPMALAHEQRVEPGDIDAIHAVAAKYYRLIFIDSSTSCGTPEPTTRFLPLAR